MSQTTRPIPAWAKEFGLYEIQILPGMRHLPRIIVAKRGGNTYSFDVLGRCSCIGSFYKTQPCRHELMVRTQRKYLTCPQCGVGAYLPQQFEIRVRPEEVYLGFVVCRRCEATQGYNRGPQSWQMAWLGEYLTAWEGALLTTCLESCQQYRLPTPALYL